METGSRFTHNSEKGSRNLSRLSDNESNAWFPPFRCRSSVAVAPLPFQLPLRRNRRSVANRIESYFCRFAIAGQPISVLVIIQTASTE